MGSRKVRKSKARETGGQRPQSFKVDPRLAAALAARMSPEAELARKRFRERFRELSGCDPEELARCFPAMGQGHL